MLDLGNIINKRISVRDKFNKNEQGTTYLFTCNVELLHHSSNTVEESL